MQTILELDNELVSLLQQFNQPVKESAREFMVLEMYRRGHISSGKAAELLTMSRWTFIEYASRLGIPFFAMTSEEWEAEREQSNLL
ncbi:MAG: UPF0175 family protein [Anaerolineales bacterium]|nr:UPF0175 family protein [Anaerolineales bacterium]